MSLSSTSFPEKIYTSKVPASVFANVIMDDHCQKLLAQGKYKQRYAVIGYISKEIEQEGSENNSDYKLYLYIRPSFSGPKFNETPELKKIRLESEPGRDNFDPEDIVESSDTLPGVVHRHTIQSVKKHFYRHGNRYIHHLHSELMIGLSFYKMHDTDTILAWTNRSTLNYQTFGVHDLPGLCFYFDKDHAGLARPMFTNRYHLERSIPHPIMKIIVSNFYKRYSSPTCSDSNNYYFRREGKTSYSAMAQFQWNRLLKKESKEGSKHKLSTLLRHTLDIAGGLEEQEKKFAPFQPTNLELVEDILTVAEKYGLNLNLPSYLKCTSSGEVNLEKLMLHLPLIYQLVLLLDWEGRNVRAGLYKVKLDAAFKAGIPLDVITEEGKSLLYHLSRAWISYSRRGDLTLLINMKKLFSVDFFEEKILNCQPDAPDPSAIMTVCARTQSIARYDCAKWLCEHKKIDLTLVDSKGHTALIRALDCEVRSDFIMKELSVVKLLVEKNKSLLPATTSKGLSVCDFAIGNNLEMSDMLLFYLISEGATANFPRLIKKACKFGHVELIKKLLRYQKDPDLLEQLTGALLQIAIKTDNHDTYFFLRESKVPLEGIRLKESTVSIALKNNTYGVLVCLLLLDLNVEGISSQFLTTSRKNWIAKKFFTILNEVENTQNKIDLLDSILQRKNALGKILIKESFLAPPLKPVKTFFKDPDETNWQEYILKKRKDFSDIIENTSLPALE